MDGDIAALDKAFKISKTTRAITVHRGFSNGAHILPDNWKTRDLKGLEWSAKGYTPTSADPEVAAEYAGEVQDRGFVINLRLPKGSPAIAIPDAIGGLDNEGEIVLPRGLTFRITKDHGAQGPHNIRTLDAEIVPAGPAKPRTARDVMKQTGAPEAARPPADAVAARTARGAFDAAQVSAVSRTLSTAASRAAAEQAVATLSGPKLRALAKANNITIGAGWSVARIREQIVQSLAGRRLDSQALSRA